MQDDQFSRTGDSDLGPVVSYEQERAQVRLLDQRVYNLVLTALVFGGFLVMGLCSMLFSDVQFLLAVGDHATRIMFGCLLGSIVAIVMMSMARKSQRVALSLVGYLLFVGTFGFTTSIALLSYSAQTISTAFLATAGITMVFGCLGVAFPNFFQRISGVLGGALLALIVVQLLMMFLGVPQTFLDIAVIVVFCGFIAHDFYVAATDVPTLANAAFNASQLFLDILNVFLRVLSIFGRDN